MAGSVKSFSLPFEMASTKYLLMCAYTASNSSFQKALFDFDHSLEPNAVRSIEEQRARVNERQFYVSFLEKLEKLLSE